MSKNSIENTMKLYFKKITLNKEDVETIYILSYGTNDQKRLLVELRKTFHFIGHWNHTLFLCSYNQKNVNYN